MELNLKSKIKGYWILAVTSVASGLVFLDITVLPVALPTIEKELHFATFNSMWIVNSYMLAMVVLFIIGGRFNDLFGKRRCFLFGLFLFAIGSFVAAISIAASELIFARVIQGVAAAFINPAIVALLLSSFPEEKRAQIIGINSGIASSFMMIGPAIGGALTELFGWRSIFWMNLPLIFFSMMMAVKLLAKEKRGEGSFDYLSASFLAASLFSLVFALMQTSALGWSSPIILSLFALAILFFFLFLTFTKRTKTPVVDLEIFKQPLFRQMIFCIVLTQAIVMLPCFFQIYWQQERGLDPLSGGLLMMLSSLPVIFSAPLAGFLADRFTPRLPIQLGFILVTLSLAWLSLFFEKSFTVMLPALLGMGVGIPMIFSPAFATSLKTITSDKLGSSSSFVMTIRQVAGTIALALMSAVFYSSYSLTNSLSHAFCMLVLLSIVLSSAGIFVSGQLKKQCLSE